MKARAIFIRRQRSKDSEADSGKGNSQRPKADQHAHNVCGAESLYCSIGGSGSSEDIYDEVYDSDEPAYSNSEANAMASSSTGLSSSHLGKGGVEAMNSFGGRGDAETFISSADKRMNKLTAMSFRPPDVVSHTVPDAQKNVTVPRKLMRSLSSKATQIANEAKKKGTFSVTLRKSDEQTTHQEPVAEKSSIWESQTSSPVNIERKPVEEPIYACVMPRQNKGRSSSTSSTPNPIIDLKTTSTMNEASISRTSYSSVPPIPGTGLRQLPSICNEFSTELECEWQTCPHLHACADWLSGQCPVLRRCRWPHSLRTAHNMTVLRATGWQPEERSEVLRWLRYQACCLRLEQAQLPPVCLDHARGLCRAQPCDALHMCPRFLMDYCPHSHCQLGHDLVGDENNRRVLAISGHGDVLPRRLLSDMKACMAPPPRLL